MIEPVEFKSDNNDSLTVLVFCGGPSNERGISINSARSVCDHLERTTANLEVVYFDRDCNAYRLSRHLLNSNTTEDFDHKIDSITQPFSEEGLCQFIHKKLVFPAIHGEFGEDGKLQEKLESWGAAFIGSGAAACVAAFDKANARALLEESGLRVCPALHLSGTQSKRIDEIGAFFEAHNVLSKGVVVKPTRSGSSIGVGFVNSPEHAIKHIEEFNKRDLADTTWLLEPYRQGVEFSVVVLQNDGGDPVALVPIEICLKQKAIFDYRLKYLVSDDVSFSCPPRLEHEIIQCIRREAERVFRCFGLRDFARIDGWVDAHDRVFFSDLNPISGMEQNSLIFIGAAHVGMSHRDLLMHIVNNACRRQGLLEISPKHGRDTTIEQQKVAVLFGGGTSERQVSLLSGSNVWLKLLNSQRFRAEPFVLDDDGIVWRVPYAYCLYHSVEDVVDHCRQYDSERKNLEKYIDEIRSALDDTEMSIVYNATDNGAPFFQSLNEFADNTTYVFNALHGGFGEDGRMQKLLERKSVPFSGSRSETSKICIDKTATAFRLAQLASNSVSTPRQITINSDELKEWTELTEAQRQWNTITTRLETDTVIVKPSADGCSTGVVRVASPIELQRYCQKMVTRSRIDEGEFKYHLEGRIEMPREIPDRVVFEEFIDSMFLEFEGKIMRTKQLEPWVEVTIGVIGNSRNVTAFAPSVTVRQSYSVLSLEEKFQQGTGINLTPPPASVVSPAVVELARKNAELAARFLGLRSAARIDAFLQRETGELKVFDINTSPAMTPATVLFQQAAHQGLSPRQFIEQIIDDTMQ